MKLLRPLAEHAGSWAVISWNDPDASDPRDVYEAAIAYVTALLDPAPPPPPEAKDYMDRIKTYDSRAQYLADALLGAHALIVRKVILPALRLGRPPKRKGPRSILLRKRWIAAVVTTVCQRHGLDPYRNPASKHTRNGCSVVAEALNRLGIGLAEKTVAAIYGEHKQA